MTYQTTENTKNYVASFYKLLENERYRTSFNKKTKQNLFILKRMYIILKSFTDTNYRKWFLKRITDKNWYHEKAIQLGLIKLKN